MVKTLNLNVKIDEKIIRETKSKAALLGLTVRGYVERVLVIANEGGIKIK